MDKKIQQIVEVVKAKHDLQVVIIYGSYARGDYNSVSDLDILGFKDGIHEIYTDTSIIEGIQLDAWIEPLNREKSIDQYLKILGGVICYDSHDFATKLMKDVNECYRNGPAPLDENKKIHIISWINKMLRRSEISDVEGNFRRIWLLNDLLKYYFELRDQWYLGPKLALQTLKENDPHTFIQYQHVLSHTNDLEELKLLSQTVINTKPQ
ncbi:MAG: nucleotidyltransferase domain-containing protein [Bacteriovoracaceae bacterium]